MRVARHWLGPYEITDAAAVLPLFEDDRYLQGTSTRALEESIASMEADGGTLPAEGTLRRRPQDR